MTASCFSRAAAGVVLALAGLAPAALLHAQQSEVRRFTFDASAGTRRVVVDVPNATITVRGWAGDSARVEFVSPAPRTHDYPPATLAGGRLVVADAGNQESLEILVDVPHDVALRVVGSNAGPVTVSDVYGDIEVENSNAAIYLSGIRGGVAASTSNGVIVALVERLSATAPLSFLTSNDSVRVELPDGSEFDVNLETDNATVRSGFAVDPVGGAAAVPRNPRALRGRVGNGGPLVRVRTDNGDIVIVRGRGR